MARYAFALLFLLAPILLVAQPDYDAAADTLVARDSSLFDAFRLQPPLQDSESVPLDQIRPAGWAPEYAAPYRRISFLGLEDTPPLILSYNRADAIYLGAGANLPVTMFLERGLQGHLGFGYAFGSHYWQVRAGLKHDFISRDAPLRIGAEGHIITDTRDGWKMGPDENTAFALLAGVDTRDYFRRSGFSLSAQQFLNRRVGIKAEYRVDTYRNSRREASWSLFGPHQPFFEVPPIRTGRMTSAVVNVIADYMSLRSWNDGQFAAEAQAEFGSIGGASFQQYVIDARAKMAVVEDMLWVGLRGRAGSATGQAPPQKLFTMGGYGTLPGFEQNVYGGNRLILLQTDLILAPFRRFGLRLIFENNFGAVATASPDDGALAGFPSGLGSFKYSTGIYIGTAAAKFRMGFAFRTDIFADPEFVVRIAQPF
jgi:hypothetical protein